MAVHAEAPVILVADIHRGGVFGQLIGTLACLPKAYRKMIMETTGIADIRSV